MTEKHKEYSYRIDRVVFGRVNVLKKTKIREERKRGRMIPLESFKS